MTAAQRILLRQLRNTLTSIMTSLDTLMTQGPLPNEAAQALVSLTALIDAIDAAVGREFEYSHTPRFAKQLTAPLYTRAEPLDARRVEDAPIAGNE